MKPRPKKTLYEKGLVSVRRLVRRTELRGVNMAIEMGNTRNGLPDGQFARLDADLDVLIKIADVLEREILLERKAQAKEKILPMKPKVAK